MNVYFTFHAQKRMETRGITKEDVIEAIKFSDLIIKKYEKYYYQKRVNCETIEIVCEKRENIINVITVYWV